MALPSSVLIVALILGISLGVLTALQGKESQAKKSTTFFLNGKPIQLEIADSPHKQYQGLSDRDNFCDHCGMLFPYTSPRPLTFVMRRMRFPLDIVWIKDHVVIGVSYNLPPEQHEPYTLYPSPAPADTVLELQAGGATLYNLKAGQPFNLSDYEKGKFIIF